MKKVLVTGIGGFAGSHLAEHLLSKKIEVFGFYHPDHSTEKVDHLKLQVKLLACDLFNFREVLKHLDQLKPDYVFHLAAFSSPSLSFKQPQQALRTNIFGQLNLLESLVRIKSKAKILIVGSADEYGIIDDQYLPANEQTPLSPISPYAVSKVTQDILGLQYYLRNNLAIVRVRPFNHIGPRQSADFVVSAFAAQIAKIEAKGDGPIYVGNLENYRDFTDVRDMVRAYLLSVEKGKVGQVYNIGTGTPVKIKDILKMLLSLSKVKIQVKQLKSRQPPVDIKKIYCDPAKFKKETGWQPKIPLLKTLSDTIDYERRRLSQNV